jgi:hypothetical protein
LIPRSRPEHWRLFMNRRTAILNTAAATLAIPAVALSSTKAPKKSAAPACQAVVFHDKYLGRLTWVISCPSAEAWEKLQQDDPYLETFNVATFPNSVVATRTMNSIKFLEDFGADNENDEMWKLPGGQKRMEQLRRQLDWLNGPFAQRFLNR